MTKDREHDPKPPSSPSPSPRSRRGLDALNFFLADVQTGVGPFLLIHPAGCGWNEERVGLALTCGAGSIVHRAGPHAGFAAREATEQ